MKSWKMAVASFSLLLLSVAVLPITAQRVLAAQAQPKTVWACSKCDFQQANAGTCPNCKTDLVKYNIVYDCMTCGMTQVEPGNCSMCGTPLKEKKVPTA